MKYRNNGIFAARNRIHNIDNSIRPLLDEVFSNIESKQELNVFTDVFKEEAYRRAELLERKKASGQRLGRLYGIPISIKDNIAVKHKTFTCASNMLKGYVANRDSAVVEKLLAEDAIIVGKTNMDEFAMGGSNTHSAYGRVKNPINFECVPGGSSGGSACSVSAGQCLASLGTDTGGSVRQPAAFCGIVGNKPTYGSIDGDGVIPMAPSFDQVGVLANNVEDNALVNSIISRLGCGESAAEFVNNVKVKHDVSGALDLLRGKRVGIAKEFESAIACSESARCMDEVMGLLVRAGANVVTFSVPQLLSALEIYKIMMSVEASICLSLLDGEKLGEFVECSGEGVLSRAVASRTKGFGDEVKKRIYKGKFFAEHGEFYRAAAKTLAQLRKNLDVVYERVDVVIWPTAIVGAFRAGEEKNANADLDLSDKLTIVANLTGRPAVSIPYGETKAGLPLGLHLMGNQGQDDELFAIAGICEFFKTEE